MQILKYLMLTLVIAAKLVVSTPVAAESEPSETVPQREAIAADVDANAERSDQEASALVDRVLKTLKDQGVIDQADQNRVMEELAQKSEGRVMIRFGADGDFGGERAIGEMLVAIVAIVLVFGTPVFIVALVSFNGYRRRKLLHDNVNKLIEQGRDIPPELFEYFEGRGSSDNTRNSSLQKGMTLSAVGIGVLASLSMLAGFEVGSLGFIPLLLGLAYLAIWRLDQSESSRD